MIVSYTVSPPQAPVRSGTNCHQLTSWKQDINRSTCIHEQCIMHGDLTRKHHPKSTMQGLRRLLCMVCCRVIQIPNCPILMSRAEWPISLARISFPPLFKTLSYWSIYQDLLFCLPDKDPAILIVMYMIYIPSVNNCHNTTIFPLTIYLPEESLHHYCSYNARP